MNAKDIMNTAVVTATPDMAVADVAQLLLDNRISGVPVVSDGRSVVGIVSEGDLVGRVEGAEQLHRSWWLRLVSDAVTEAERYVKLHGRVVRDVMTPDPVTVTEDVSIAEIAHILETKHIKRVPVVRDGKLVGIVSRADLLRGLAARRDAPTSTATVEDETIRKQILQEIEAGDWAPTYGVSVMVVEGIVQIWGFVDSQEQREALRVAAGNVPGVKGVELNVSSTPLYGWE